jgi:prepilin-type N-terminal cleavage/methylation domain-containing protein
VNSPRPAFTLFELLVTTAVIAILASLVVPSMDNMYPSYKLNASIDAIRAAWALGRAHAIEEGRPYRFAYGDSGHYQLGPDEDAADGGMPDGSSQTQSGSQPLRPFLMKEQLPDGVVFGRAQSDSQQSQSSSDGLSTVAVFLPDGTARNDAEITITVPGAKPKTLKLRSLTGAVTVQLQQDGGAAR